MALSLRRCYVFRPLYITSRHYAEEEKSVYQRLEEGEKPRSVYGQLYPHWRKPWIKRDGEWKSKLSLLVDKSPSPHILNAMQQIPNLTFEKVKNWWNEMKELQEIHNQKYLLERVTTLGSNLAALHFFTYRQCKVRLKGSSKWIEGDILSLKLPDSFQEGYYVEAIDCENFHHNGIRYEGIQNFTNLNFLKWLSLKNNKHVDVWCLDRLAGQNANHLEYLNIEGIKLCPGCIYALARMKALKVLVITDPGDNLELQAALSVLEKENPDLLIKAQPPEQKTIDRKTKNL